MHPVREEVTDKTKDRVSIDNNPMFVKESSKEIYPVGSSKNVPEEVIFWILRNYIPVSAVTAI